MTTMSKCRKKAQGLAKFVIVHTPGHVDATKRATDRGYSVVTIEDVRDFIYPIDALYNANGIKLDLSNFNSIRYR